jgi:hypothetical protein
MEFHRLYGDYISKTGKGKGKEFEKAFVKFRAYDIIIEEICKNEGYVCKAILR